MKQVASLLFAASILPGCSGGSPSQGEIEEAIKSKLSSYRIQECPRVVVENVAKQNGMEVDSSHYQIAATYDIRIVPVDGLQEPMHELVTRREELNAEFERQKSDIDALLKQLGIDDTAHHLGHAPEQTWPEPLRPQFTQLRTTGNELTEARIAVDRKWIEVKKAWGPAHCGAIASQILGFNNIGEAMLSGQSNSYEVQLDMVKTDNGWM